MSYGHPCRRMTAGPSGGPASAYPTLRTPASICFSESNELCVPAFIGVASAVLALVSELGGCSPAAAAARRRRSTLIHLRGHYARARSSAWLRCGTAGLSRSRETSPGVETATDVVLHSLFSLY